MGLYFGGIYSGVSGGVGYIQKHFRVGIFMGLYMDGAYITGGGSRDGGLIFGVHSTSFKDQIMQNYQNILNAKL